MAKQYVFWRTSQGRRYKGGDDRPAPVATLSAIGESATVNADNSISWPAFGYSANELALHAALSILSPDGTELNEHDSATIIWEATKELIRRNGGGQPLLPKAFREETNRQAAKHFRKSVRDFVLVTTLSVADLPAKRINMTNGRISALKRRTPRFALPDAFQHGRGERAFAEHLRSTSYLTVRVATSGRTVFDATDRALSDLNLLRGIWTLAETWGRRSMHFGAVKRRSLGVVHIGPIHTLHHVDGTLAADTFWYEPHYSGDRELFEPKFGWPVHERFRRRTLRQIKRVRYGPDLKELLIRYAVALDHADWDASFLQLWGLLEKITGTVGAGYDETIERASWIYRDNRLEKERLSALRFRRNQYVHSAKSGSELEELVYTIKSFADPHLVTLIYNEFEIDSLQEHAEVLALPNTVAALQRRLRLLKRAMAITTRAEGKGDPCAT